MRESCPFRPNPKLILSVCLLSECLLLLSIIWNSAGKITFMYRSEHLIDHGCTKQQQWDVSSLTGFLSPSAIHETARHFAQSRGWQTKAQVHLLCPVVYSFTGKQPRQPVYVWSVATFALYRQSCVIAIGSTWPIKLKILSDLCQKKFVSL